jgi:hypothetical protein
MKNPPRNSTKLFHTEFVPSSAIAFSLPTPNITNDTGTNISGKMINMFHQSCDNTHDTNNKDTDNAKDIPITH